MGKRRGQTPPGDRIPVISPHVESAQDHCINIMTARNAVKWRCLHTPPGVAKIPSAVNRDVELLDLTVTLVGNLLKVHIKINLLTW